MLFTMENKTCVKKESVQNSIKNDNLNEVCTNLQFSDDDVIFTPTRKRCISTSILIGSSPKKKRDGQNVIPPKKFLLGGNMYDPLNLNSLQNDNINKAMNKTPKSSPLHSNTVNIKNDHINVIIPRDLSDPLDLSTCEGKEIVCLNLDLLTQENPEKCIPKLLLPNSLQLSEFSRKNKKIPLNDDVFNSSTPKRKCKINTIEKKHTSENNSIPYTIFEVIEEIKKTLYNDNDNDQPIESCNSQISKTLDVPKISQEKEIQLPLEKVNSNKSLVNMVVDLQSSSLDKNSKPVIDNNTKSTNRKKNNPAKPKIKGKNALFKYGNYNRYYGYRNPDIEDSRLKVLSDYMHLFYGRDVLDIGCNIGHVTFSVARDFGVKSIVGMDIDRKLINIARKNVQYYINDTVSFKESPNYQSHDYPSSSHNSDHDLTQSFPISLPLLYGPINLAGMTLSGTFPYNVSFIQGNYVLESDEMLSMETCKFDVILCLSITKWLHLNFGDDGLKRSFKRMYAQLKPGGVLIIEPQPWKSYFRRKTLTETIWKNYNNIEFKPPMFTEYLLSEVGFANCETLAIPHNPAKGFQRPLKLYRKPNITRNQSQSSTLIK